MGLELLGGKIGAKLYGFAAGRVDAGESGQAVRVRDDVGDDDLLHG